MFIAISGTNIADERSDLGHGVVLRKVYAHVFSTTMVAFQRAKPGEAHPAPWKPVVGGSAFDIEGELYVPDDYRIAGFDQAQTIKWLIAGLRLAANPTLVAPAISQVSFAEMGESDTPDSSKVFALEASRRLLVGGTDCSISDMTTCWYAKYWHNAGALAAQQDRFALVVQALDEALFASSIGLGTVLIWGGLEGLFLREHQELSFRVASAIAAFLEPPGRSRLEKFQAARRLYSARSRAAHGADAHDDEAFKNTWMLAVSVVSKIVRQGRVPTQDEVLELLMVGSRADATGDPRT